ncbi:UvrD-helicase domain-containing protein [Deferrisoma palaeochoriense]
MEFLADLHIHSRFSRATSRSLNLPELHAWAQRKGLYLVGTGDVTHPAWFAELSDQLVEAEPGLYRLRDPLAREADAGVPAACRGPVRFVLQGEVSCIYKHGGAVRKVHHVVFLPHLEAAGRFLAALDRLGHVRSDGRPILGLSSRQVLEILLETAPGAFLVPAHVWTPWFSILGSRSGYDAVEACFEDLAGEVFALETGLSSDPAMNWRVSALDRFALISSSDAHSAANLGREACRFALDPSFGALRRALEAPGRPGLLGTLEFFPEEGKYHLDGHRKCGVRLTPAETRELGGRCPACGGRLTVGVLHRVEELADRPPGARPPGAKPFQTLVPLAEVVAEALGTGPRTKRVGRVLGRLAREAGPELPILLRADPGEVARAAGPVVAEAVGRVREGRVHVEGGYDGAFGVVRIFSPEERREIERQGVLFAPGTAEEPPQGGAVPPAASRPPEVFVPRSEDRTGGDLDPEQEAAVAAPAGPLRIVAGPGTGKTRTLVERIARRVTRGEVDPDRGLAVTFTNRAADELAGRLGGALGGERIRVSTLHKLALEILREAPETAGLPGGFRLLDRDEALAVFQEATGLGRREAAAAAEALSRARRSGAPLGAGLAEAARAYEAALTRRGALDLDQLVLRAAEALEADGALREAWRARAGWVAVDEFQDLDPVQYRLLRALVPSDGDLTVIGDPDQSIYGFRGADPGLFDRLAAEDPGLRTVRLRRTYRCSPEILRAAGAALGRDGLVSAAPPGPAVRLVDLATDRDEAAWIAREIEGLLGGTSHRSRWGALQSAAAHGFGDVAVLVRTRAQAAVIAEALERQGFPVQAGEAVGPGWRRVRDRLRRADAGAPALDAARAALEAEGVDPEAVEATAWLAAAAGCRAVGELLDRAALAEAGDAYRPGDRIAVLTLHAAKGLEFPVVFVAGCEDGLLPYRAPGREGDREEERRLLYVGMTRAREVLVLTRARERRLYGERRRPGESPFLEGVACVERISVAGGPRPPRQLTLF